MTDPFDRDPIARELRASLERHAHEAPRGDLLAQRIINQAEGSRRSRRNWRTWTMPLVAAGAVAAVVGAIAGVESLQTSANGPTPATSNDASVLQSPVNPTQTPSDSALPSPTTQSSGAETLRNVKVLDLTFVSENQGWALAAADCVSGPGRCSALFHMKGAKWWSMPNSTPFNVEGVTGGCTDPCVTNIRFADKDTGYAFGPSAFFMTKDGGNQWTPEAGGAIALETLDNNVIRVTATSPSGCPGPCGIGVETAAIGSNEWTPRSVQAAAAIRVVLSRGGADAYLLLTRNPAAGAGSATSTLYRSTDDGVHWIADGEPCPQTGGEVDSYTVAAGSHGAVSVLCAARTDQTHLRVAVSTDDGATFSNAGPPIPSTPSLLSGDPATVLVAAGDGLALSRDGGKTWHVVTEVSDQIGFVGFESTSVGRAVSADGKTIWTTRDAGQSWTPTTFS